MSDCLDEESFASHDRSIDDTAPSDSRQTTPSFSAPSPLRGALSSSSSSFSCDDGDQLSNQQRSIALLQQDVFALRHLLESELSKMRQQMKETIAQMETRVMDAIALSAKQRPQQGGTLASHAALVGSAEGEVKASVVVKAQSSSAAAAAVGRRVWSGDFLDSECGDDFAPSHPSQYEEKEQNQFIAAIIKQEITADRTQAKMEEAQDRTADSQPQLSASASNPPQVAKAVAALPALLPSHPSGPLSIPSLTALINPAGLPLTESQLIALACRILSDHGSVPVGKMGSLLHKAANDHTLPQLLKERYGGLKKFLQAQSHYFVLGEDHPYNPHVALVGQQQLPPAAVPASASSSAASPTVSSSATLASSSQSLCVKDGDALHGGHGAVGGGDGGPSTFARALNGSGGNGLDLTVGSTNDAYARSLVDSFLMDDRDSFFSSCATAARKAIVQPRQQPPSELRPFFSQSSSSSCVSFLSSCSSRLHDSLHKSLSSVPSSSVQPDFQSLSQHMDSLLTDVVALDCEMVGCGIDGSRSLLARASIVSYEGHVLYDTFVQPPDLVSDYRTHVSGIRPGDLEPPRAIPFHQAQREVQDLIQGRVLVAHSVVADLQALGFSHPPHLLRDTAHFPLLCPDRPRPLRSLVVERLGWTDFQCGEHDSVDDARAVMGLYRLVEEEWEAMVRDERAREDREKKALAAKSAASARQRALMVQQQQQQQLHHPSSQRGIGYSCYSSQQHHQQQQQPHVSSLYGGSGMSSGGAVPGVHSCHSGYGGAAIGAVGGHQFGLNGSSPALHHDAIRPSQPSIHSALWK